MRELIPNRFSSTMLSDPGLFAVRLGQLQGIAHDAEVVAVGSLLHDLGLTNSFTGQKRFEIEGADAARAFAREQGLDDRRVQLIWTASR